MKVDDSTPYIVQQKLEKFSSYIEKTTNCSLEEKIELLDQNAEIDKIFKSYDFPSVSIEHEYLIKQIIFIGQYENLLAKVNDANQKAFEDLLIHLSCLEHFYADLGGVIGYHVQVLKLLHQENLQQEQISYHPPHSIDLEKEPDQLKNFYLFQGIKNLPKLAMMHPIGGAADRLNLKDPHTQMPLPAACLSICNKTLLQWLIDDVIALESLYEKCFHEKITISIAMMTSLDLHNHSHILDILKNNNWFGRDKSSFHIFPQPLVPAFDKTGQWVVNGPFTPFMRPGGHGVLWKLAEKKQLFETLFENNCEKALVRQINNPVAAIDDGLLTFFGLGIAQDKKFGFLSCKRIEGVKEGLNVVKEFPGKRQKVISNVEYCDLINLNKINSQDELNQYPSNANILFVDLKGIKQACHHYPYPGAILNFKHIENSEIARLELTMQSLAEYFTDPQEKSPSKMQTFLVQNKRIKTISTAKKAFEGDNLAETPASCFFDILQNRYELLKLCGFTLPQLGEKRDFAFNPPPFAFDYHPKLGPLFSIIKQKIYKGSLAQSAQWILNIEEILCEDIHINGSLSIEGKNNSACILKHIYINNQGLSKQLEESYWQNPNQQIEKCQITLHENSLFIAENVTLAGNIELEVEPSTMVIARQKGDQIAFEKSPLTQSPKLYQYIFDEDYRLLLNRASNIC